MNKYNNKQEEERANKVLGAMMVLFCILILLNYVTL